MNEIMIAICDDSADDCSLLKDYLHKAERELNRKFQVCIFQTGSAFPKKPLPVFDIVFLGIHVPDINVEKAAQTLLCHNSRIHLVLLSDHPDSMEVGYQYGAKNYLIKPVSYVMILKELKRYIKSEGFLPESFLWISNRDGHFRLYYSRLRYIETANRYLIFHYNSQILRYAGKISDFKETLPENIFFRCNNSYIVNVSYISRIAPEGSRYNIWLVTGEILPLSRSRYRELLLRLYKMA